MTLRPIVHAHSAAVCGWLLLASAASCVENEFSRSSPLGWFAYYVLIASVWNAGRRAEASERERRESETR